MLSNPLARRLAIVTVRFPGLRFWDVAISQRYLLQGAHGPDVAALGLLVDVAAVVAHVQHGDIRPEATAPDVIEQHRDFRVLGVFAVRTVHASGRPVSVHTTACTL